MSHREFVADPLADILDRIGGNYCIDCHLTVEPERAGEERCLLCQRAYDQHLRECGD